ncbi:MAG: LysR family transcriptional regulator [Solobacterium sp.]|nr:LysR family transcriptional regulator [Solobacterium sp.]
MYNHQLDTFIKTADLGSFGKAADALYISSTAVIQQINLLENQCGFRLFVRSNHGVKLTPAGRSLYEDACALIRLSNEALQKAQLLAESSESTVRIGTSLLYKCRKLPDLWTKVSETLPDLRIEIRPMIEYENRATVFSRLGIDFDLFEGIYASAWKGACNFLELQRTPVCCALSRSHPLAEASALSMQDLKEETLVMPVRGVSEELDAFRDVISRDAPPARIIDSTYYGMDTFAMCEISSYILITQPVYEDIHPNLKTIPLDTPFTMPYGLIYAKEPAAAALRFINAVKHLL